MKFLAILKDSLREAIDAKVFYVMASLSLLLILLAATATFPAEPAAEPMMKLASLPLSIDTEGINFEEFDPEKFQLQDLLSRTRGMYQVIGARPVDGEPDAPGSTFLVTLRALPQGGGPSASTEEHIRQHFGVLGNWRIAEALEVRPARADNPDLANVRDGAWGKPYEVTARITSAGRRLWPHRFSLFFGALPLVRQGVPLGAQLFIIENYLVGYVGAWVAVLVSIVITAFFIPNMLRKGTIDLLLVRPIGRTTLLLYKFVGGLLFIFLNTALAVSGTWLALSARSGVWATGFLYTILVITFFFAILYAVSTLFGVLTRSPIAAILLTCAAWFAMFLVGQMHGFFNALQKEERRQTSRAVTRVGAGTVGMLAAPLGNGPLLAAATLPPLRTNPLMASGWGEGWFARSVSAVHFVLPRTHDLDSLTTLLLLRDLVFANQVGTQKLSPTPISWGESLAVSGLFIALMLGISCWWFATKDY